MPCTTPYARTPCDLMTAVRHIGSEMRNIFKNDQNLFKFFGWLLLGLAQFILCSTLRIWKFRKAIQWRHSKFEPDKAQYSTPNFFDRLFLIRAYWNPKFRQGPGLGGLSSCGGPADAMSFSEFITDMYVSSSTVCLPLCLCLCWCAVLNVDLVLGVLH